MTQVERAARILLTLMGLAIGYAIILFILPQLPALIGFEMDLLIMSSLLAAGALVGGLISYLLAPSIIRGVKQLTVWFETRLKRAPIQDIIAGSVGLIIGLIIANLLGSAFSRLPWVGAILSPLSSVILGYLGISVAVNKREEIGHFLTALPIFGGRERATRTDSKPASKILDTSVIIDGRIADICKSGFIEGPIVIPGFVLEELRHIADSSDLLKRNRGRRGLDILNRIQKELDIPVQIIEKNFNDVAEVDSKLVKLAKQMNGKVITNDYNLNKVAELQGVPVLNINELANAVKPVVLPGEEMTVHILKDGKEPGQGVAYLDDGTMIVVDGGKRFLGETVEVMVTSVLQTAAGRMIFAKLKIAVV
jgi:uncharacterized protein YacL